MSTYDPQETDIVYAFQKWKRKWEKEYPSTEEEKARFQDFKHNVLHQPFIPASDPLWDLLNDQADEPRTDNFNYIRLDFCKLDEESDDDLPNGLYFAVPDKKEDGTIGPRYVTPEEFRCYWEQKQDDTKEEDQDDATVKRQNIDCRYFYPFKPNDSLMLI